MNRFKMNAVNCAMLGAFVCAMPKQPGGGYRRPERQVPAGHLHWMGSIPFLFSQNKTASRWDAVLFWSRVRESNPPLWLGKRPFYR